MKVEHRFIRSKLFYTRSTVFTNILFDVFSLNLDMLFIDLHLTALIYKFYPHHSPGTER